MEYPNEIRLADSHFIIWTCMSMPAFVILYRALFYQLFRKEQLGKHPRKVGDCISFRFFSLQIYHTETMRRNCLETAVSQSMESLLTLFILFFQEIYVNSIGKLKTILC